MKRLALLLFLLPLWGCVTTAADLRSEPVERVLESPRPPGPIADSLLYRAPAEVSCAAAQNYLYDKTEYPPGTFHITAICDAVYVQHMAQVDISPRGAGSFIEMRTNWRFWCRDSLWQCVTKCAAPAPDETSAK